jgi:di/tricarboxylate transporter
MLIPIISLISLVVAIVIGFWKNINVGLIAIVFAFILGVYVGGISEKTIMSYWPIKLFITTFGITLLFSIAKLNGTLEKISKTIIYQSHGKKVLIPIIFYVLAVLIASVGPGNISTSALLLPIGLVIGHRTKISTLMMSTLIILGSIAGGLSPLAPNGIVALDLAASNGVGDLGLRIYIVNVISMTIFAIIMFVVLGGLKLRGDRVEISKAGSFNKYQIYTLVSIFILVLWVILGGVNVGFAAFALSAVLLVMKAADQNKAIANVPWSTLLLICGTAVLINVISDLGGVDLLTNFLASLMNKGTAIPIMAVLSGVMSIFSSAVGVVMPTLIPTTVNLSAELGSVVSPAVLTITIAVASHIVTMSPFSTMGALALASSPKTVDKKLLFKNLFITAFASLLFIAVFLGGLVAIGYLK